MKNIFYKITARTMGLNRTRTIVTILGVILSAAMLMAVAVFGISVLNYIETKTVEKEGSWHVAAEGFTEKELQEIRKDKRIKSLSIQREIGYLRGSEADGDYIRIFSRDNSAWKNLPLEIEKGRIPENEREILIPYEGIELEGKKASVGDTVTLKSGQFFMDGRHMVSDQAASLSADGEEEAAEGAENSSVSFQENESGTYQVVGVYHDVQQARAASGFFGYMLIAGPYGTLPEHSYCDVYIEMKNPKDADAFIEDWLEGKEYGSYVSWSRHDSLLRWQGVFRNDRYTYMIGGALGTLLADGSIPFHCSAVVLQDKDYETYLKEQRLEKPKSGSGVIYAIYYDQVQSYNEETQSYDKVPALTENVKRRELGAGRVLHRKDEKEKTGDAGEYEQLFQVELAQEARELPLQCRTENVFKPVLILSEEQAKQYAEYIDQPVKEGWEAEEELYIAYFQIHAENYIEAAENLEEEIQNMPEEQQGSLYTPAEDAAMSRQAVTAIRVLCYGFIVLLSMIAVANVFNTISTNLMLRRKEFAMLRSVGMTGKGFRKMMLYECLVYGTRSVLYGCILSSAVSILFWKFTSQASGQELIFPWSYFLTAAAGVLAIVLVTMIYTMRKIRKFNIIDELRMA
ncbi:FtsX-like permease family protein [Mordavella massiliensis]|uniref:ABC transporter permease n=1 Tax=Mordavella massiliensis TaxID=1871024 RepID=UPI00210CF282|nr:ABC transporter permease [Mordavella massiliensis]